MEINGQGLRELSREIILNLKIEDDFHNINFETEQTGRWCLANISYLACILKSLKCYKKYWLL